VEKYGKQQFTFAPPDRLPKPEQGFREQDFRNVKTMPQNRRAETAFAAETHPRAPENSSRWHGPLRPHKRAPFIRTDSSVYADERAGFIRIKSPKNPDKCA